MEFQFLYAIPRTEVLDTFFLTINKITGSYGQLWVIIAVILLLFKKTRKIGVAVLVSYVLVFVLGQLFLPLAGILIAGSIALLQKGKNSQLGKDDL